VAYRLLTLGDPRHAPHPDTDPAVYGYYRELFALRRDYPELARGEVLLHEVECDNPQVFVGLRRLDGRVALAIISLTDKPQRAKVTLTLPQTAPAKVILLDPHTAEKTDAPASADRRTFSVELKPFQVLVSRISE